MDKPYTPLFSPTNSLQAQLSQISLCTTGKLQGNAVGHLSLCRCLPAIPCCYLQAVISPLVGYDILLSVITSLLSAAFPSSLLLQLHRCSN